MIELTIESPDSATREVVIDSPRTTIGRSPRSDLTIDDRFASRLHAELRYDGSACRITDLGSANGTLLNGVSIRGSGQVFPNDEILIGDTSLRVEKIRPYERDDSRAGDPVMEQQLRRASTGRRPTTLSSVETVVDNFNLAVAGAQAEKAEKGDLLPIISRVGIALLSPGSLDDVLAEILDLVFDLVPADHACVILNDFEDDEPLVRAASYCDGRRIDESEQMALPTAIRREVLDQGEAILASDIKGDKRFRVDGLIEASGIQSLMAAPMRSPESIFGLIQAISTTEARTFDHKDLGLLTAIASVAAIKVENTFLLEQRIAADRLKQRLESARHIQLRLFPDTPPSVENYDLTGISLPCEEVGGDYFDFVPLADGSLLITLGDISGKGLDAALLMSSIHATVRAQIDTGISLIELSRRVNAYLCESAPHNKFATLFCARLSPQENRLCYVNCGHNPPVLARTTGRVESLNTTALPVGIFPDIEIADAEVELDPGDVVLIYSDGLNEAESPEGEQFGAERIAAIVERHRDLPTPRIRDLMDEALLEFTGDRDPIDDLTLVLLKRLG